MTGACEIHEQQFPTGKCLYRAIHKPTGRLIGIGLSREAAEGLIKAGSMFMDWDTLTGEKAAAMEGGPALLEHWAAQYGVTPKWLPDAKRPFWFTAADEAMLDEIQ